MRILICGGRDYDDYSWLSFKLTEWLVDQPEEIVFPLTIIHGGARGADTLAGTWAKNHGYEVIEFPADWSRFGNSAGPIRNKQMLQEGKPDLCIAFPGGKGTMNMIHQAVMSGVPTVSFKSRKECAM